ncbi:MAG: FAD:protein FMN transferase [Clostridiaceae bacterium]|nr:FAD:protein FMN transferase [Clostridiaceae bacterium]
MRKKFLCSILMLQIIFLAGCSVENTEKETGGEKVSSAEESKSEDSPAVREIFAMDTYMTVTAYGEKAETAAEQAQERIQELDAELSTGEEDSEIYQLNKTGSAILSDDAAYLYERSMEINQETDGAFQPFIYPIMELWGFTSQNYQVPKKKVIKEKLLLMDISQVSYDQKTREIAFLKEDMKIDFGGIAKGYASDEVVRIFGENGVSSGMISLGGNVWAMGRKTDGSLWRVAIQNPEESEDYLGVLEIENKAVITSGGYERYFEQDGKRYHHIIDPSTGYPAENGLTSVTIISEDGTLADALSTSLYVMGLEKAVAWWRGHSSDFDVVLLTDQGQLYVTEGIASSFSSDFDVEIIEK